MSTKFLSFGGSFRQMIGCLAVLCCLAVVAQGAVAAEDFPPDSPHALVQEMTEELLLAIEEHRAGFAANPEPFLSLIDEMLRDVVDFHWIARNVMGPHFQQASEEQVSRFAQVFRTGLIATYGQGLMNFSDQSIEVLPPREGQLEERRVSVTQRIHNAGNTYPIVYSMTRNREGEWQVINVIINGINLGMTFRNQFQQAVQQQGDIERVIAGWSPEVALDVENEG